VGISARGDLNPLSGFYFPLFSMMFPWEFPSGYKAVDSRGRKTVAFCGGSTYKVFICIGRSAFPRGYQKSQFNGVLSAHRSFARPTAIPFAILSTSARKRTSCFWRIAAVFLRPAVAPAPERTGRAMSLVSKGSSSERNEGLTDTCRFIFSCYPHLAEHIAPCFLFQAVQRQPGDLILDG
jgi:hypothetical protein